MGSAFSLGKSIVNDTCGMHQVQCAICLKVEGKEKLLVLKLVSLLKHASRRKAKVPSHNVEVGFFIWILKANMFRMKKST
jgi:hypothetical protein